MTTEHIEHALYNLIKDSYSIEEGTLPIEGFKYYHIKELNLYRLETITDDKMRLMLPIIREEIKKSLEASGNSAFVWEVQETTEDNPSLIDFVKFYSPLFFEMFNQISQERKI